MQSNKKIILGYVNIANCITLLGMLLALASCVCAMQSNLKASVIFLVVSGICDLFDGVAARKIKRTDSEKEFGIQLDTVVDVVSFGMTPAIIVYSIAGAAWYALLTYAFYIICAVNRLAYFNTSVLSKTSAVDESTTTAPAVIAPAAIVQAADVPAINASAAITQAVDASSIDYYHGMPVTYIALILPIALLFRTVSALAGIITLAAVGILYVLNIKVPKPRGVWYVLFPIIAAVIAGLWWLL